MRGSNCLTGFGEKGREKIELKRSNNATAARQNKELKYGWMVCLWLLWSSRLSHSPGKALRALRTLRGGIIPPRSPIPPPYAGPLLHPSVQWSVYRTSPPQTACTELQCCNLPRKHICRCLAYNGYFKFKCHLPGSISNTNGENAAQNQDTHACPTKSVHRLQGMPFQLVAPCYPGSFPTSPPSSGLHQLSSLGARAKGA